MMKPKGISVIVCCYNSALQLPNTIRHLALQQLSETIQWEVIIVNNASSDNTEEVSSLEWSKYSINAEFKIAYEKLPGIINARRKGISISKFEYIVFCDDDNWLKNNYLQTAYNLLEQLPQAGVIGGKGEVVTNGILPIWWQAWENGYGVGSQAKQSGDITERGYLWGAGLISRASILNQVFNPRYPFLLTGRKGNLITSGDDSEICSRIILLGWRLFYNDNLQFFHYITKERLTIEYKEKLSLSFESMHYIQEKYNLAIEYSSYPLLTKIFYLFKRILSVMNSKFNKRKIMLLKSFIYFAFGWNLMNDNDFDVIYNFVNHK